MNKIQDPIKSGGNYKEQKSFQTMTKENKIKKNEKINFKKQIIKGLIIIIIFINLILIIGSVMSKSNENQSEKYKIDEDKYHLTYKNNKVVVAEDTIPKGTYKITAKLAEDDGSGVIVETDSGNQELVSSNTNDEKIKNILMKNYMEKNYYQLNEDGNLNTYIDIESGEKISIDKKYSTENSEVIFEKVDKAPELKMITDTSLGEYTTNKSTIEVEVNKDEYLNDYQINNEIRLITISGDKVWEYLINYNEFEKIEYKYDEEIDDIVLKQNQYYDLTDVVDKKTNTIKVNLLADTYISINS